MAHDAMGYVRLGQAIETILRECKIDEDGLRQALIRVEPDEGSRGWIVAVEAKYLLRSAAKEEHDREQGI